jgi:predicted metal-dependent hydrolase
LCGALLVFPLFHVVILAGLLWLLPARRALLSLRTFADLHRLAFRDGLLGGTLRFVRCYLRPSFHPWDVNDYHLAQAQLAKFTAAIEDAADTERAA